MLDVSISSRDFKYFLEKYIKIPGEGIHNYSSPKHEKRLNKCDFQVYDKIAGLTREKSHQTKRQYENTEQNLKKKSITK